MKSVLAVIVMLSFLKASAQLRSVGISAFPTLSQQFSSNQEDIIRPSFGLFTALHLNFFLREKMSFVTGLEYQINSPIWELENFGANGEKLAPTYLTSDVHLLSVPILLQEKFGNNRRVLVEVGYTFSRILQSGATFRGNSVGFFRPVFTEKKIAHAVVLGVGFDKKINDYWSFEALLRTDVGFGGISDDPASFRKLNTFSLIPNLSFHYNLFTTAE